MEENKITREDAAQKLGLGFPLVQNMVKGKAVKGSCKYDLEGGFVFRPAGTGEQQLQEMKKTKGGSRLAKIVGKADRMKMTLLTKANSEDPVADFTEEFAKLMKGVGNGEAKISLPSTRMLLFKDGVKVRTDAKSGKVQILIEVEPARNALLTNRVLTSRLIEVTKIINSHFDTISKLKKS